MTLLLARSALWSAALLLLLLAAWMDLRSRIIPNRLVLTVSIIGLTLGVLSRPQSVWINVVAAFLLVLGLGFLAHYDIFGAGDAKLMAAVSLLVPPEHIGALLFAITLLGGVLSAVYLALHTVLKPRPAPTPGAPAKGVVRWLRKERARIVHGRSVPYGLAITAGTASYLISELHQCLSATSCSL